MARICRIRERLGSDAYREAVLKAAVAVARVALSEAEERARERDRPGNVVRFRRCRKRKPEPDS
jgi:hypothetical protein